MSKDKDREERLAAKLRENLRRRKAQAKGMTLGDAREIQPQVAKGERPPAGAAQRSEADNTEDANTDVFAQDPQTSLPNESKGG